MMQGIGGALKALAGIWAEMFMAVISVFPKFIRIFIWALLALFILPCVFVAGTIYPAWEKWGQDF
ncbi:MAG: hypothetical protein KGI50_05000 [Patescibacteria group bacterium]|nr:hypothetical protein [Patescibacteria group bacterium]MDE2438676.1 hypothetical protein [Patescibacteria group bacterium]